MEFETLRESSILAGTDAVEHSSIAKNWTTDMQQSFPYQHKNLLEDAMDTIFKLSCALKEETKNEMSTSSSFWVTIFFLSIFSFYSIGFIGFILLCFYRFNYCNSICSCPALHVVCRWLCRECCYFGI